MLTEINLEGVRKIDPLGGCPEVDLLWLAEQVKDCEYILELGSYHGRSARAMLDNSEAHLWCVDSWRHSSKRVMITDEDYIKFIDNTRDLILTGRITVLKMTTEEAARQVQEQFFDLVFIDATHSYESVKNDILLYRSKVRPGGVLCGHDYNSHYPGCVRAVQELVLAPQRGGQSIWWVRNDGEWMK